MAADSLWWSVWWPWTLLWAATLLAMAVSVVILIAHWRSYGTRSPQPPEIPFYLHETSVMGLYRYGPYIKALEQQVEKTSRQTGRGGVGADIPGVKFDAGGEKNREELRRYIERAEPITVIGIVMHVLEDDIIQVDLEKRSVVPSKNLVRSHQRSKLLLSELVEKKVLVSGIFRKDPGVNPNGAETSKRTTFLAAYGDPADPAQVEVQCATKDLRDEVPERPFRARCLGTVQGWDPGAGKLAIDPIAIFR